MCAVAALYQVDRNPSSRVRTGVLLFPPGGAEDKKATVNEPLAGRAAHPTGKVASDLQD